MVDVPVKLRIGCRTSRGDESYSVITDVTGGRYGSILETTQGVYILVYRNTAPCQLKAVEGLRFDTRKAAARAVLATNKLGY